MTIAVSVKSNAFIPSVINTFICDKNKLASVMLASVLLIHLDYKYTKQNYPRLEQICISVVVVSYKLFLSFWYVACIRMG